MTRRRRASSARRRRRRAVDAEDRLVARARRSGAPRARPRSARPASRRACSMTSAADIADRRPLGERPAAVLLDADRHRLVALAIEVREDGRRRGQRHLVLARPSAVDDADAKSLHGVDNRQSAMSSRQSRVAVSAMAAALRVPCHASRRAARGAACSTRRTAPVETPVFMPVGTRAAVKGVTPRDLRRDRRAHRPRQHLPPLSAARRRADRAPRRPAPLHGLGRGRS